MRKKNKSLHKHPNTKVAVGGSAEFHAACTAADYPATHRQWKKFKQKRGVAYAARSV